MTSHVLFPLESLLKRFTQRKRIITNGCNHPLETKQNKLSPRIRENMTCAANDEIYLVNGIILE